MFSFHCCHCVSPSILKTDLFSFLILPKACDTHMFKAIADVSFPSGVAVAEVPISAALSLWVTAKLWDYSWGVRWPCSLRVKLEWLKTVMMSRKKTAQGGIQWISRVQYLHRMEVRETLFSVFEKIASAITVSSFLLKMPEVWPDDVDRACQTLQW